MCLVCRDGHSLTFLNINFMTQYFSKFQNNNQQFRGAQTRVWYKTTCDLHASFCSVYCKWLNCSNLNTYLRSFPEPPFLDDVPTPLQGFWHLCQKRNGAFKRVRILFRQQRNNRRGNHFCSEGFYKHRQQQRRVDLEIFLKNSAWKQQFSIMHVSDRWCYFCVWAVPLQLSTQVNIHRGTFHLKEFLPQTCWSMNLRYNND